MYNEGRLKIYVDCETTGLSPFTDELVEVTYAVEQENPVTLYFGVETVPDFIDNLIGFTERKIAGVKSTPAQIKEFRAVAKDATMVSANPKFDQAFLEVNGLYTFHYRTLDMESYAMHALDLDYVPGMSDIYELLTERGYDIVRPDHTSRNDVLALRRCFEILKWQFGSVHGE